MASGGLDLVLICSTLPPLLFPDCSFWTLSPGSPSLSLLQGPLPPRWSTPQQVFWSCSEPFSECFPWTSCIGRILCWPWEFLPYIRPGRDPGICFLTGLLLSFRIWELGNSFPIASEVPQKFNLSESSSSFPPLLYLLFFKSCRGGVQFSIDFHYRCSVCDRWFL